MVDNSRFARLYIQICMPLLIIRFAIHLIFLAISDKRNLIINDAKIECEQYGVEFSHRLFNYLWLFRFDTYFITLFYYRLGSARAFLCRLIKQSSDNFSIVWGGSLKGVVLYHPFATIINAADIGEGLVVRNNTTIGNTRGSQQYRPIIGRNVNIGANCVIIGKIKVGDNVTIGAGTVVTKDVPDNAIIVGNPYRIIGYNENS